MDELALTPFQRVVAEVVLDAPAPGKHCARSAMAHIQRAWAVRLIDPEMAAFRAITGEEESATAIFHALQRRKYPGSRALKARNHRVKSAVIPFVDAIALAFAKEASPHLRPELEVDTRLRTKRLQLRVNVKTPDGEELWQYPDPPLGFAITLSGVPTDFSDAIAALATRRGATSMAKLIEKRANHRNQLLYATSAGIPRIVGPLEPPLLRRRDNIYRNLAIFLLIDQYSQHQLFVQQALRAFSQMMNVMPRAGDEP
jgi:hypothetical protein